MIDLSTATGRESGTSQDVKLKAKVLIWNCGPSALWLVLSNDIESILFTFINTNFHNLNLVEQSSRTYLEVFISTTVYDLKSEQAKKKTSSTAEPKFSAQNVPEFFELMSNNVQRHNEPESLPHQHVPVITQDSSSFTCSSVGCRLQLVQLGRNRNMFDVSNRLRLGKGEAVYPLSIMRLKVLRRYTGRGKP
eukprot:6214592-Pleurochrysis_carterae.AAC.1